MGVSKIEQLIEDIYEFIESCKMQPLSSTKVIVPKDELYDLLDELRIRTPDEIKRYQKIISNRDAILSDAQEKANTMLAEAEAQTNALVDEHQIMQQAYYQANDIVNQATEQANQLLAEASEQANAILAQANADADQIRSGALGYTNDLLVNAENILSAAYESSKNRYESLLNALQSDLQVIASNRQELFPEQEVASTKQVEYVDEVVANQAEEDDYNFDEDTFLKDIDEE